MKILVSAATKHGATDEVARTIAEVIGEAGHFTAVAAPEAVASVDDLVDLLWEVQGELGASHAYVAGGDTRGDSSGRPGLLGADLEPAEDGWRVARVLPPESSAPAARSPLSEPGVDVRSGDVILEVKQVPDLAGVSCVVGPRGPDPFRVIVGQSRLGTGDHGLLGYVTLHEKAFYVQSWQVNYTELRIEDFATPDELIEVARDVGIQLGNGHPKLIAAPRDVQLRRAILASLDRDEATLYAASQDLERRVVEAWAAAREP